MPYVCFKFIILYIEQKFDFSNESNELCDLDIEPMNDFFCSLNVYQTDCINIYIGRKLFHWKIILELEFRCIKKFLYLKTF